MNGNNCIVITKASNGWIVSMPIEPTIPGEAQAIIHAVRKAQQDPALFPNDESTLPKQNLLNGEPGTYVFKATEKMIEFLYDSLIPKNQQTQ